MLAGQCLASSYDVVELPDADAGSIRRLERGGLRCVDAGMVQAWIAPPERGDSLPALLEPGDRSGDWVYLLPSLAIDELGQDWPGPGTLPGATFWSLRGHTILRRAHGGEDIEVTARVLPETLMAEAAMAIACFLGAGDRVLVPLAQTALIHRLASAGFAPGAARPRWALMPLLNRSLLAVRIHDFMITAREVNAFGASSGDMNPLHFDDEFARSHGFKGRITHGMIFNGWLTRLLGTDYPGKGTIYLANQTSFLAPVYPDAPHTVRISTPMANIEKGTYLILAQLRDEGGETSVLSYNDVLRREIAGTA